jgi:hypothetical protein
MAFPGKGDRPLDSVCAQCRVISQVLAAGFSAPQVRVL